MKSVDHFLSIVRAKSAWIQKFPTAGTPEPLLSGRKFFYRFVLLNHNIKMVYYIESDVIHIVAFWDMRMSPENLIKKI